MSLKPFASSLAEELRRRAQEPWEDCYRHPFVQELGAGTLSRDAFRFYLKQDYVYLLEYAKVFALGTAKARTERALAGFTATQHAILCCEMEVHRGYMKEFGITPEEAESTRPSLFNKAYTSNMLSVALAGGVAEILAVVLPCAWSYYDFASRLAADHAATLAGNYYRSWIEAYAGKEYCASIAWLFEEFEAAAADGGPQAHDRLAEIFRTSMEFEFLFWEMSHKQRMSY